METACPAAWIMNMNTESELSDDRHVQRSEKHLHRGGLSTKAKEFVRDRDPNSAECRNGHVNRESIPGEFPTP